MVDIKKIDKQLEKFQTLREKLDYLESLLKKAKKEEKEQINKIIDSLFEQSSLEGKITSGIKPPKKVSEVMETIEQQEPQRQGEQLPTLSKQEEKEETKPTDVYVPREEGSLEIYAHPSQSRAVESRTTDQIEQAREIPGDVHLHNTSTQYTPESRSRQGAYVRRDLERAQHKNISTDPIEMLKESKKKSERKVYTPKTR